MLFLNFFNYLVFIGVFLLTIPIIVFTMECLAAMLPQKKWKPNLDRNRPTTAILIPAHNEAEQIGLVVREAMQQLQGDDRLVVIADNCQDETAAIARKAGAIVVERIDENYKGKGYALDCGLNYLKKTKPPEIVVFLDADCVMNKNAISDIICLARSTGRPVQAKYLMEQYHNPNLKDRISTFALQVKNRVRFLGLNRLGGHCLLTGSGMAFPWSAIEGVSLVGAVNADDMKLTVDLALENFVPIYCESALVVGRLMKGSDAVSQKTRWEHGHLDTIATEVPRLIKAFIKKPRLFLLLLALDISVPPLSLLVMIWTGAIFGFCLAGLILQTSLLPTFILAVDGLMMFIAVIAVWYKFGTKDLPLKDLMAIPFYILSKIPIYLKFMVNPQTGWLSTERDL